MPTRPTLTLTLLFLLAIALTATAIGLLTLRPSPGHSRPFANRPQTFHPARHGQAGR